TTAPQAARTSVPRAREPAPRRRRRLFRLLQASASRLLAVAVEPFDRCGVRIWLTVEAATDDLAKALDCGEARVAVLGIVADDAGKDGTPRLLKRPSAVMIESRACWSRSPARASTRPSTAPGT